MTVVNLTLEHALAFDRAYRDAVLGRELVAFDRLTVRHFDADGRMHVERCNISKANVCPYFGREIPDYKNLGLDANRIYMLYRDPAELARGAATFKNLQLLMLHKAVNAAKPGTEITVGTIGSDVEFNAPYLQASVAVWTAEAIRLIDSKQQAQLSCSYRYRADMTPGVSPEGVAFDGVMRDIMGNHVALVEHGRAGPDVYVSDSQPVELPNMKRTALVAAVIQALASSGVAATITPEAQVALDAALDTAACAAEDEAEVERKKKAAEDAAKCAPASMTPAAMDAAITAKGYVTKGDAERMANDAAAKASADAVQKVNALHKARKDVEPLVGVVAMDSAEDVYAFALKQSQVATDGVPAAAFGALVEQVKQRKIAPVVSATPKLAADSASAVAGAIPGLGRIAVA